MKISKISLSVISLLAVISQSALSYPPAVGILGKSKSCLSCHVKNGPWTDDARTIIDIIDKETMKSLRQSDGTFLISVKRGEQKTVLTVIGRVKGDASAPYRNAWLYVDPATIETKSLSKFAPGWAVNLPVGCRIVGDELAGFDGATITALPMTVMPLDDAVEGEIQLQVMLTGGEAVKGSGSQGMIGNYFERRVKLKVNG